MATYTIKVINQSGVSKGYVVFMGPPVVTSPGGAPPVYTNAWATFEHIVDGGWSSVSHTSEATQTAKDPPAPYFAVAEAAFAPGQVLQPPENTTVATIGFAGRSQTTAVVTEHSDGGFSAVYA